MFSTWLYPWTIGSFIWMGHLQNFADGPSAKFCGWETGFPPKHYCQMGVDGTKKPFDPFQDINMNIGIQIPE